ncbi:hypothetical protein L1887_20290 [Cichorium endivia]|nr:hypothetical protein L1887_20290 [Cichorium endivia]
MGGYWFEEDCGFIFPHTLVLVGKNGNGKSATRNTILGMQNMFPSKRSSSTVTNSSELKTTTIENGQTLNVIDTPGLFGSSLDIESIGKEIFNCMNMGMDGVDAFLVVISIRTRFSNNEKSAISRLLTLFGRKIYDYMILVFTGGDELEDEGDNLEDFLRDSPEALQETLCMCENRCVLFDNMTIDPTKRSNQVQKLLSLVSKVLVFNGGKPYTNELFTEAKVELKLKETTLKLEQLLTEERTARLKAEENAKIAQNKSDDEIQKFESKLKETTLKFEQLLQAAQNKFDKEIQKQDDPNEQHCKEQLQLESFEDQLLGLIFAYKQAAAISNPKYEHINLSEKQKVLNVCSEASNWLKEKKQVHESLPKHADPILLSSDIKKKVEEIDRECRPIMSKPRPGPTKVSYFP